MTGITLVPIEIQHPTELYPIADELTTSAAPALLTVSIRGSYPEDLSRIAELFFRRNQQEALQLFEKFKTTHQQLARDISANPITILQQPNDLFTEVEWLLYDNPVKDADYYYAQICCIGELVASALLAAFLGEKNIRTQWLDARDFVKTDNQFRSATIDAGLTEQNIQQQLLPLFPRFTYVVTQNSIGSTPDNENTLTDGWSALLR